MCVDHLGEDEVGHAFLGREDEGLDLEEARDRVRVGVEPRERHKGAPARRQRPSGARQQLVDGDEGSVQLLEPEGPLDSAQLLGDAGESLH